MNAKEWAAKYRAHLEAHRPSMVREMQAKGQLASHVNEVGRQAAEMEQAMERQYLGHHPPPEDYQKRAAHLGTAKQVAAEIVDHELILVPAESDDRAMWRNYYAD